MFVCYALRRFDFATKAPGYDDIDFVLIKSAPVVETLLRTFVRQIGLRFADDEMLEGFAKCGRAFLVYCPFGKDIGQAHIKDPDLAAADRLPCLSLGVGERFENQRRVAASWMISSWR